MLLSIIQLFWWFNLNLNIENYINNIKKDYIQNIQNFKKLKLKKDKNNFVKKSINKNKLKTKYLIQFIIKSKENFSCNKIFEIIKKNKIKKYVLLNYTLKKDVENCYKIFNLNKEIRKKLNWKIIWYNINYWIFSWMNDAINMKDYKSILKRKNIKLITIKYLTEENYYLMYLYHYFIDNTAFNWIILKKDYYLIDKKKFIDYLKFKKYINENLEKYLQDRKKFYEKTKIRQNVYNFLSKDSIKCNTYTLVEFKLFNDFLINLIYNYNHKIEIKNKLIEEYQSKKIRNEYFKEIDNYRRIIDKKYHYKWWESKDVLNFLNWIYYSFKNNWKREYLVYSHMNIKTFDNVFSKFLYIKSWLTTYHSWLRLCSIYSCYQYWPEKWYWEDKIEHKFMWINRTVMNDLNIIFNFIEK